MKHTASFTLICYLAFVVNFALSKKLTDLEIDNHPCKPEVIKAQHYYACTKNGTVVCRNGYKNPENLCRTPVCEPGCGSHGTCIAPNTCACQIGWDGNNCDVCLPAPGCVHGNCTVAFECNCDTGFQGGLCDRPVCSPKCGPHGSCTDVNTCTCHPGWTGPTCETCVKRQGCQNGVCQQGNDCVCNPTWAGSLCDQPVCNGCSKEHGQCVEPGLCKCDLGWKNENCTECLKAPGCPANNTCNRAFGCISIGDWVNDGPCLREDGVVVTSSNCSHAGLQNQNRTCTPWNGCPGCSSVQLTRRVPCNLDPCPIDGGWTQWTVWSGCTTSCTAAHSSGPGNQVRRRTCTNPAPGPGGRDCTAQTDGPPFEREARACFGNISPQTSDPTSPCFDIGG